MTLDLCALGSALPKVSLCPHRAAGERVSPLRPDPVRTAGCQLGHLGSLSPVDGPRRWWLPAPARAVLGSPAALCVHSEECSQPKFLRDLFLLAGKDGAGCPCPQPRKQQRNLVVPSWSSPGVYHTWDPAQVPASQWFGAERLSPCIRTALVGLFWSGTTAPRDPAHAHVGLSPSFAVSVMFQGRLESIDPTLAQRAGSKAGVTHHVCCSQGCCSACFDRTTPRRTTGSSITRHGPFSLGRKGHRSCRVQPRASGRDGKPLTQRDTWPRRGHRCSSTTDCRREQSHSRVQSHSHVQQSHPCARAPTPMSPWAGLARPDVPAQGWTHAAHPQP